MKFRKVVLLMVISFGLMTLMSTTCDKNDPDPGNCTGVVSASASGFFTQSFCFDDVTSYTFEPENRISFWARETSTDFGMDVSVYAKDGIPVSTGTYNCGSGEQGFVELITAQDGDFYKSQSGTLTITSASATSFKATFNVTAQGYYNKETITFSGTISK